LPSILIAKAVELAMALVKLQERHMYRSLLIPLDGSAFAEHALPMALSIARRLGAALQVVMVHVPIDFHGEDFQFDATVYNTMRELDRAYLDNVVQRLSTVADNSPSSALLDGPVASAISRQATESGVDLLIMTTHGRGPLARFWLGSVADALVRQTTIPILLVRPQPAAADLTQGHVFKRVQIPLDGSELAEQILEPTLALAAAMQAEITLLRVVVPQTPLSYDPASTKVSGLRPSLLKQLQELDRQEWTQAEEYLERVSEELRAQSLIVQTRVVSQVQPAAAILEDAATHGADLIALATHGRGGLKRLLLGSVADKVLRGATTPVLVYRAVDESTSPEQ
jgi:nucleotide-binding universal stress UspA family protein